MRLFYATLIVVVSIALVLDVVILIDSIQANDNGHILLYGILTGAMIGFLIIDVILFKEKEW